MEMSRLTAQFTAATTDTALPLTPIGKISLMTTYTTEKTAEAQTQTVSGLREPVAASVLHKLELKLVFAKGKPLTWSQADGEGGYVHQQADQRRYVE